MGVGFFFFFFSTSSDYPKKFATGKDFVQNEAQWRVDHRRSLSPFLLL